MTRINVILSCLLPLITCAPNGASAINVADFIDYSLRNASNQVLLPGRLYVPPEAQLPSASPRPLIINLAGGGGNGTDNSIQLGFITDVMMAEAQQRGAFIYAPQTVSSWSTTTVTSQVMTMIDRAINTLNADTNRFTSWVIRSARTAPGRCSAGTMAASRPRFRSAAEFQRRTSYLPA